MPFCKATASLDEDQIVYLLNFNIRTNAPTFSPLPHSSAEQHKGHWGGEEGPWLCWPVPGWNPEERTLHHLHQPSGDEEGAEPPNFTISWPPWCENIGLFTTLGPIFWVPLRGFHVSWSGASLWADECEWWPLAAAGISIVKEKNVLGSLCVQEFSIKEGCETFGGGRSSDRLPEAFNMKFLLR